MLVVKMKQHSIQLVELSRLPIYRLNGKPAMRIRWICDFCHKQIHGRKQISCCNRIEHWVYIRYAGICLAQYTDTWTCHPHKKSGLTTHTNITPPLQTNDQASIHSPPTPPTQPQPKHIHTSNTPPVPTD